MDYLMIAYGLIAIVLVAYTFSIGRRMRAIQRDRAVYESKDK
jgi:CcmD family protein